MLCILLQFSFVIQNDQKIVNFEEEKKKQFKNQRQKLKLKFCNCKSNEHF